MFVFFIALCYNTAMNCVRVKAYAKINLTLFVCGAADGYHKLDSLVASVGLYDTVTVRKRRDGRVTVKMLGAEIQGENNAVKAAELFIKEFATCGADITVIKRIPMGAGLGGSSADAAGVLNALARLYRINDTERLAKLADATGSDTRYMLGGGWARLFGRGDTVKKVSGRLRARLLLLVPEEKVSTPQCFAAFDKNGVVGGDSDEAERAVNRGDVYALAASLHNALMPAAVSLSGGISDCADKLKGLDPLAVNMTGSGSGVYALFASRRLCVRAKRSYRGTARAYILKTR